MKLYSQQGCAPCATLIYWLNKNGVKYTLCPPNENIKVFPTIELGKHRIEGLNIARLKSLLE